MYLYGATRSNDSDPSVFFVFVRLGFRLLLGLHRQNFVP